MSALRSRVIFFGAKVRLGNSSKSGSPSLRRMIARKTSRSRARTIMCRRFIRPWAMTRDISETPVPELLPPWVTGE